ncbi:MFS transporter [Agrobacterium sp. NPDC090283]|uniref:MFS transporter n=1 Tax=Agrobacterium sp. NPDC090283 TaxID=3363920 RepID=UPI00383BA5FB
MKMFNRFSRFISANSKTLILPSITFISGLQTAVLSFCMPIIARSTMELNTTQFSTFFFLMHSSGFLVTLVLPYLTDLWPSRRRLAIIITLLFQCIGFGLLSFGAGFLTSVVAAVFFLGPGLCVPGLVFALARDLDTSGSTIVRLRGLFAAAWVIGPIIGSFSLGPGNAGTLLLAAVALNLLGVALVASFRAPPPISGPTLSTSGNNLVIPIVVLTIAFCMLQGANIAMVIITPVILTENVGVTVTLVGYVFSLCALLEFLMMYMLSKYMKDIDQWKIVYFGCFCGIIYSFIVIFGDVYWIFLVSQIFNATFIACFLGVGMSLFQGMLPGHAGLLTGVFVNTSRIGAIIATPLIALAVNMTGEFQTAAIVSLALTATGFLLLHFSRIRMAEEPLRPSS